MTDNKKNSLVVGKAGLPETNPGAAPKILVTDDEQKEVDLQKKKVNSIDGAEDEEEKSSLEPDPETLHTTDPQEHMKGPVSSFIQKIKEAGNANDDESKEEADKKKEENT